MKSKLLRIFISLIISVLIQTPIIAQELGIGVATFMKISESVEDGDIISLNNNSFVKSIREYDPSVVGVIVENPALVINPGNEEDAYPVISSGEIYVKVSSTGGEIQVGDVLTTSSIPGVAMKATKHGFALGIAKENFSSENQDEVGKIKTDFHLHYTYSGEEDDTSGFERSLNDIINLSKIAAYESPSKVLQYIIAGTIVIMSFIVGFLTFSRIAARGIEALGRNPLAGRAISLSIALNVSITIVIIIAGLALAYLVIIL